MPGTSSAGSSSLPTPGPRATSLLAASDRMERDLRVPSHATSIHLLTIPQSGIIEQGAPLLQLQDTRRHILARAARHARRITTVCLRQSSCTTLRVTTRQ